MSGCKIKILPHQPFHIDRHRHCDHLRSIFDSKRSQQIFYQIYQLFFEESSSTNSIKTKIQNIFIDAFYHDENKTSEITFFQRADKKKVQSYPRKRV